MFLAAAVAMGAGYSLLFLGGIGLIRANAPARYRAGTLSAVYLIAYLMQGVTALLLGAVATASGLKIGSRPRRASHRDPEHRGRRRLVVHRQAPPADRWTPPDAQRVRQLARSH
jgi:hypothetical protein